MAQAAQSLEAQTMEAARSGSVEDLALIEHGADAKLLALLESHEPIYRFDNLPLDGVPDRFRIELNRPLPAFDSGGAKAYSAHCLFAPDRQVYALVCDPRVPTRLHAIKRLRGFAHPQLPTLHDAEIVRLSQPGDARLVLFFDKPQGVRLSELLAQGRSYGEATIIEKFLNPIIDALSAIAELGVRYGHINPSQVFVGDSGVVLGECASEPQGLSQDYLYEPLERALADPYGKGMATTKSDAYALGMLAYDMLFGLERFRTMEKAQYLKLLVEYGSYHLLTVNKEISDNFTDFFRGTLNENKAERWGIEQLKQWSGGKRFNLIHPSLPKESSRSFTFCSEEYFNLKALAHGIHRNWHRSAKELRGAKLDRWLEMSAHRADLAERMERIQRSTGGESTNNAKMNNEFAARAIITLDPTGPIRMEKIAINVDGIGGSIAHYLRNQMHQELNLLVDIVQGDLPNYWADSTDADKTEETSNTLWKLQTLRVQMQSQIPGFGMERAMYTLNPSLPCLSDLVARYHVATIEDMLLVLDAVAKTKAADTSLLDRHIAAFLAAKLEMNKEHKFHQLARIPKLRDHPELQALRILSLAQDRLEKRKLVGLSCWAALRVEKLAEHIHNRRARRKLTETLRQAAATGNLRYVLAALTEGDLAKDDLTGFLRATAMYDRNLKRLNMLENPKTVAVMSRDLGGRISVFVSYLILGVTAYVLLEQYFL